jgi:glycosyltransferase involved in cell wall biosynthesis
MQNLNPIIAVLIPLYNKADFIEPCVTSVLAQDYANFEIIVVDDGSTDDGVGRLQRTFHDPRIRLVRQANAGVGAARNRALRESRAPICAFLDADDEWLPTHLSDLFHLAATFPDASVLATRIGLKDGNIQGELKCNEPMQATLPCLMDNYLELAAYPGEPFLHTSACAFRRNVIACCGTFLEGTPYGEDQEYWVRLILSHRLAFHPRISALYRRNVAGSAMSQWKWSAAEFPVLRTLRRHVESHPAAENRSDILNYAASVLMSQAVWGIKRGSNVEVRKVLADPMLKESRYWLRLLILTFAAAMPEQLVRRALAMYNTLRRATLRRTEPVACGPGPMPLHRYSR